MAKKKRTKLSNTRWGQLFQEAGSHCSFCPETSVASLQVHHIDGAPANNAIENLILVCATCHTKITAGILSETSVRQRKLQFAEPDNELRKALSSVDGIYLQRPKFLPRRLRPQEMRMS